MPKECCSCSCWSNKYYKYFLHFHSLHMPVAKQGWEKKINNKLHSLQTLINIPVTSTAPIQESKIINHKSWFIFHLATTQTKAGREIKKGCERGFFHSVICLSFHCFLNNATIFIVICNTVVCVQFEFCNLWNTSSGNRMWYIQDSNSSG